MRERLNRVGAVMTRKGGVGKTTITDNVAGLLAAQGLRVLVIDLDHQGHVGIDFGFRDSEVDDDGEALYDSLTNRKPLRPLKNIRKNLDVVAGGSAIEDLQRELYRAEFGGEDTTPWLAESLAPIAGAYDLILIDCPPGVGPVQEMAAFASRWILAATQADDASIRGIEDLGSLLESTHRKGHTGLTMLGVVLTMIPSNFTRRINDARQDLHELGEGVYVFDTIVPDAAAAAIDVRKTGQLFHELKAGAEQQAQQKIWLRVRRKEVSSTTLIAQSVVTLAETMEDLAAEVVERIASLEQKKPATRREMKEKAK